MHSPTEILNKMKENAERQNEANKIAADIKATRLTSEPNVQRTSPIATDNRPSPVANPKG